MEKALLGIAQYLEQHPILVEKSQYKLKYLNVLEYFVRKYSSNDIFASSMLQLYIQNLRGSASYSYNLTEIKKSASSVSGLKFKWFKLFTYRYTLLFDCFFINCFSDYNKALKIKKEIDNIFAKRYQKKINALFEALYADGELPNIDNIEYPLHCWMRNKEFMLQKPLTVLITATMSAGKSTLINALVGKKINRTQNDVCTAKIHYIFNKPYEDGFDCKWDHTLDLNADQNTLKIDNNNNDGKEISVGTFFRSSLLNPLRMCFVDTPGVNSALNEEHKELTYEALKSIEFDKIIYVLNGENIGTFDDRKYLEYIYENFCKDKIIFVLNKLDRYKSGEDSIRDTIEKVIKDLVSIGFKDPLVCPVSAYAGLLAKQFLYCEALDEEEQDELEFFVRKFKKPDYNLADFYFGLDQPDILQYPASLQSTEQSTKCCELLLKSGILNLEKTICRI